MEVAQNGCFIMENPWTSYKNGWFRGTPISGNVQMDQLGHLGTWRSDEIRSPAAEREQSRHNCGNRLGSSVRPMGCTNGNYHFLPWCTMYPTLAIWITMFCWIFMDLSKFRHDFPANHRVATGTRSNRIPSGRLWSCEADSKCAGLRRQHAQSMLISSSFIISRALNVNLNDIIHDLNIF